MTSEAAKAVTCFFSTANLLRFDPDDGGERYQEYLGTTDPILARQRRYPLCREWPERELMTAVANYFWRLPFP